MLRRHGPALLLLAAVAAGLHGEELLGRREPFYFDISSQNWPAREWAFRQLRQGHFPEWCPHLGVGFPFVAESQSGIYYPPNYLIHLPGFGVRAMALSYALHLFVAGVGTRAWCLAFASRGGALLAGLMALLGGRMLEHQAHTPLVESLAWLPALLACVDAAWRRGGRWTLGAGLVAALAILAGFLQIAVLNLVAAALWLLGRWLTQPTLHAAGRALAILAGTTALAAGLSALLWLPVAELLGQSLRGAALDPDMAAFGAVGPTRWPGCFFPWLFGHPGYGTFWRDGVDPLDEMGLYHGALSVPLAAVGLWAWRRQPSAAVALATLGLAGLLLAAGPALPTGKLLRLLPLFGNFRCPDRYLAFAGTALCGLAGLGWDALRAGVPRRVLVGWALACLLATTAVAALVYQPYWSSPTEPLLKQRFQLFRRVDRDVRSMLAAELPAWGVGLLGGLVGAALAGRRPRLGLAIAATALIVDVGHYHRGRFPTAEPGFHTPPGWLPAAQADPNPRVLVRWTSLLPWRKALGNQRWRLLDALGWMRGWVYFERGPLFDLGVWSDVGNPPLWTHRLAEFREALGDDPAATAWLAATSVLAANLRGAPTFHALQPHERVPFAVLVPKAEAVPPGGALARMQATGATALEKAFIETADPLPAGQGLAVAGQATWVGPNRFMVELDAPRPGALLVHELHHPGWTATVSGRTMVPWRANHLFQAVPIPAGRQRVEFAFASSPVRWGRWGSVCALLAWLAWWLLRGPPAPAPVSPLQPGGWLLVLAALFIGCWLAGGLLADAAWPRLWPTLADTLGSASR